MAMGWNILPDGRSVLPEGAIIRFSETGSCYQVTGSPVGYGGSGILYPAVRVRSRGDHWEKEEMRVALKECCPIVPGTVLKRDEYGEISGKDNRIYQFAEEQMRKEKEITGTIFNRGFRLTPIVFCGSEEEIAADGEHFSPVRNLYTLMERLDEKGVSLGKILSEQQGRDNPAGSALTIWDMVSIMIQVLASLKEVHAFGYIHGDIQANNLFLKGYRDHNIDQAMISLIDFGSARKLEADGKTLPIRDRALFTTEGYAPPECIYENDGTLQLDTTADLYSAGYLFLCMVTGKEMRRQALELVTNQQYLYQRRADRIGCPPAATAAVNRVLSKALQSDRTKRYQSAAEMMEDLERIERTLSPVKSAISATDYCAFISYSHSPENERTARLLQKKLEQYRIPKVYRNRSEKHNQTLGKVFLDSEELSSSPDLGKHLDEALEHSRYLIVLLSPETRESPWVNREIGQFLKNHTYDQILTVLVSGSVHEGLPPLLEKQDKWEDGAHKKAGTEGLAADLRAENDRERKKKLQKEVYRLIAPMLGCGYDDLRQRQKEYRNRILLRVVSAAFLCISVVAGIVGWQAFQIKTHYRQVLKDNAQDAARISSQLLSSGDRIGAAETVMHALPSGSTDQEKPLVLKAQAALSDAVQSYSGALQYEYLFSPDRKLSMRNDRSGIEKISPDGEMFLSMDTGGNVYLWKLEDGSLIWEISGEEEAYSSAGSLFFADFLDDETVLLAGRDGMCTVDLQKQAGPWIPFPEGRYEYAGIDACALDPGKKMLAIWRKPENYFDRIDQETMQVREDADGYCLSIYRVKDGGIVWEDTGSEPFYEVLNGYSETMSMLFSEDSRYLAAAVSDEMEVMDTTDGRTAGMVVIVDLEERTCRDIRSDGMNYTRICFLPGNRLALFGYAPVIEWEYTEYPLDGEVRCLDLERGDTIWVHPLVCQLKKGSDQVFPGENILGSHPKSIRLKKGYHCGIFCISGKEQNRQEPLIGVWCSRDLLVLDSGSGEERWKCIIPEGITGIEKKNDTSIYWLGTKAGGVYSINFEDQMLLPCGTGLKRSTDCFLYDNRYAACIQGPGKEGEYVVLKAPDDRTGQIYDFDEHIGEVYAEGDFPLIIFSDHSSDSRTILSFLRPDTGVWYAPYQAEANSLKTNVLSDTTVCISWSSTDSGETTVQFYDAAGEKILFEKTREGIWRREPVRIRDAHGILRQGICLQNDYDLEFLILTDTGVEEKTVHIIPKDNQYYTEDTDQAWMKSLYSWDMVELTSSADGKYLGITFWYLSSLDDQSEYSYYIYETQSNTIEAWEAFAGKKQSRPYRMQMGQKNRAVFYDDTDRAVHVLDLDTRKIITSIPVRADIYHCYYQLMEEDKKVAVIGEDGYLKLYDADTGELQTVSEERYTDVYDLSVSELGGLIELQGFEDISGDYYIPSFRSETQVICWFYQIDENGLLCRMGKTVTGGYNEALDSVISISLHDPGRIWIWKWHTLDDLLEMGRSLLETGQGTTDRADEGKEDLNSGKEDKDADI